MEMLLGSSLKLTLLNLIFDSTRYMYCNLEKTNIVFFILFRPWLQSVINIESNTKLLTCDKVMNIYLNLVSDPLSDPQR